MVLRTFDTTYGPSKHTGRVWQVKDVVELVQNVLDHPLASVSGSNLGALENKALMKSRRQLKNSGLPLNANRLEELRPDHICDLSKGDAPRE